MEHYHTIMADSTQTTIYNTTHEQIEKSRRVLKRKLESNVEKKRKNYMQMVKKAAKSIVYTFKCESAMKLRSFTKMNSCTIRDYCHHYCTDFVSTHNSPHFQVIRNYALANSLNDLHALRIILFIIFSWLVCVSNNSTDQINEICYRHRFCSFVIA